MAGESTSGRAGGPDLPPELAEWLDHRASDLGVNRAELVVQVLAAYRSVADETDSLAAPAVPDLDERLAEFRTELDGDLNDIRRRIVQVKREADQKAPADHTHEAVEDRLAAVEEEVSSLADRLDSVDVAEELDTHEERLDATEEKLTRVASAVVALRRERTTTGEDRLADIKRQASRLGVETATCHSCGETVSIALLPEGSCPHCEAAFGDVTPPGGGLFSKARLTERQDDA